MAKKPAMSAIFLAASIPDAKRDPKYYRTMDAIAIRESVLALARVFLPRVELVFGGHPAISPFVLQVAVDLNARNKVFIYQSRYFEDKIPAESKAFENLRWTDQKADRATSLTHMRRKMIGDWQFVAGVFIGGMEGVVEEFQVFRSLHPTVPVFPIASTGAAALEVFQTLGQLPAPVTPDMLEKELAYRYLFYQIRQATV